MNRAFTSYEVMTTSNIGWRPYWILRLWRPQRAPALAPSKNEFSMFWSTSVSNCMLVDKCAQYHPNCSLSSSTMAVVLRRQGGDGGATAVIVCFHGSHGGAAAVMAVPRRSH